MTTTNPAAQGSTLVADRDGAACLPGMPERADGRQGSVHAPLLLFCAVFAWTYYLSALVSPRYFGIGVDNFWFDADVPRYVCQSVDAFANDHWRNKVHPLFSLLVWPLPNALHLLGLDLVTALRLQTALVAATGMTFLYLALRRLSLTAAVAALLIAFTATGASAMAWFAITESYAYTFAALSILLYMLTGNRPGRWRSGHWAAGTGLAFAVTISNVVPAGLLALQALGVRRALRTGVLAVAAVGVLAIAQRLLFPSSGVFFLPSALGGEAAFMYALSPQRLRELFAIVFFGSFVFLDVRQAPGDGGQALTVQHAALSSDALAVPGLVLLGALYLAGLYRLMRRLGQGTRQALGRGARAAHEPATVLAMPVLGGIAFLLMLHAVYGKETFLYTGSFLPFLTVLLGIALASPVIRRRRLAIPILACLLAGNVAHNGPAWRAAAASLHQAAQQPLQQKMLDRNTCGFVKRNLLS